MLRSQSANIKIENSTLTTFRFCQDRARTKMIDKKIRPCQQDEQEGEEDDESDEPDCNVDAVVLDDAVAVEVDDDGSLLRLDEADVVDDATEVPVGMFRRQ